MNNVILHSFMSFEYENNINKQMLYKNYVFPLDNILEYIDNINKIPIASIVEYLQEHCLDDYSVSSREVFQFSSFYDSTYRICEVLKDNSNAGVSYLTAGKLLLNDGKMRKNGALTKYGENHLKTSESLSLTWNLSNVFFLTCIGFVYPDLPDSIKHKLLSRLILRSKFIRYLICSLIKKEINLRQYLCMISDSTYLRRRSNIKTVIKVLLDSEEYNFKSIFDNLLY